MSVTVRPAGAGDRWAWDEFVAARAEGDLLQLWAWGDVRATEGERPLRLVATGADGSVRGVAGALVRATSFGRTVLYVPHGPLWEREAPDGVAVLATLLQALRDAARRERGIVVKVDPRSEQPEDVRRVASALRAAGLRQARHDLQARSTRIVDLLDGGAALAGTWDKDERNRVRRAGREGVTTQVERTADAAAIEAFLEILRVTSARGGFAIHGRDYLLRLAASLAPSDGWFLALASLGGRPIAGAVTARVGDRAFYLYGASLRDPALRHAFGSDAALAAAMAALASDGVRTLDLWGVAEPGDARADADWAGFSLFKRRFGGRRLEHPGTFDLVVDARWFAAREARERVRSAVALARRRVAGRRGRRAAPSGTAGTDD